MELPHYTNSTIVPQPPAAARLHPIPALPESGTYLTYQGIPFIFYAAENNLAALEGIAQGACRPAEDLKMLLSMKANRRWKWIPLPGPNVFRADCHATALNIASDLYEAQLDEGWSVAQGIQPNFGPHSWLECDGWAVDFSAAKNCLAPVLDFYTFLKPLGVKRHSIRRFVSAWPAAEFLGTNEKRDSERWQEALEAGAWR